MPTGRKSTRCLELEKGTPKYIEDEIVPSPFEEIFKPENRLQRSKEALGMRGAETVSEMLPEITQIAKSEGLNLNNPGDWKEAVRIMRMDKLGKR